MKGTVTSLLGKRIEQRGGADIGGGIFSLAQGMAKRIRFLLDLLDSQNVGEALPQNLSERKEEAGTTREKRHSARYLPIVRGRTIRRTMKALGRRGEGLERKIKELRNDPERLELAIRIFLAIVLLKVEHKEPGTHIPSERIDAIVNTEPFNGHELDAIIEILTNFGISRRDVFQTIRGDTAKMIKTIEFSDVYNFLKNLPKKI